MNATETGFMEAICADPRDAGLRLIFADWLEENGQPERAEFIRVQCEIARAVNHPRAIPMTTMNEDRHERLQNLCRRERALLSENWAHWLHRAFDGLAHDVGVAEVDPNYYHVHYDVGQFYCSFYRGFIEFVSCWRYDWSLYGPKIVRMQPVVKVRVDHWYRLLYPPDSLGWARGPHPKRGFDALPKLEEVA